ncbi:MAG: hypothetical protein WBX25_36990, partial [Rhodomicrobium sp.]
VDEPLVNTYFETIEDLERVVSQRCVALIEQRDAIRASTLFHSSSSPPGTGWRPAASLNPWGCEMTEERVEVSQDGLTRLQSAAADFARIKLARIVQEVIDDLRSRPALDIFGDVAARHLWDEYCWALQEGPFDDDMVLDNVNLGSLSGAFEDVVRGSILAEVEKLPQHAQVFLSTLAFEEDDSGEEGALGIFSVEGIVNKVTEEVNERASGRNLDLIGPNRGDTIG